MDYNDEQMILNNKNERHVEMAREYCDEHEAHYQEDTCEPRWCENGDLDIYLVEVHDSFKAREEFVKKRNKERNHKPKQYKRK